MKTSLLSFTATAAFMLATAASAQQPVCDARRNCCDQANLKKRNTFLTARTNIWKRLSRRSKKFLNHAYELFSSTLYDEIAPPSSKVTVTPPVIEFNNDLYNPDMGDEAAPHFPIRVDWDEVFQEFDPKLRPEQGGVSDAEIDAKFGALIAWVKSRIAGTAND